MPESYPYTLQTTAWTAPDSPNPIANVANQGEAYLLPLIPPEEHEASERSGNAFAGPLPDASETGSVMQRYREGQRIAQIIGEVMQTRRVLELVDGQK